MPLRNCGYQREHRYDMGVYTVFYRNGIRPECGCDHVLCVRLYRYGLECDCAATDLGCYMNGTRMAERRLVMEILFAFSFVVLAVCAGVLTYIIIK